MLLETIAIAIALGISAQVLAERLHVPAILPLLILGILGGPNLWSQLGTDFHGLFDPESLGEGLDVLIHLGIAVILFEGGLSLDPKKIRRVGSAVRNLLTIGVFITGVGAAVLAAYLLDLPIGSAALFGAIVTVTGPTVVAPLLRHMVLPPRIRTVLLSEGLIIDPIGVVLAYLVLLWVQRPGMALQPLFAEVFWLTLVGVAFGFCAGSVGKVVVKARLCSAELRNLAILALLMLTYLLSDQLAHQSGILAAMVMGFTMSSGDLPDVARMRTFKEQLTVLLISVLFILLAGKLDLEAVFRLGWAGVAVVIGLIVIVRPLAVFLSVFDPQFEIKDRLVLALTAPRGIVAAGVASLSAQELSKAGLSGGEEVEGLVYLTIVTTVLFSTIMAVVLPKTLGYLGDPSRRLAVLVGGNSLSLRLAKELKAHGRTVAVIDSDRRKLEGLDDYGIVAVPDDARDASALEKTGIQKDSDIIALTTNDELNLIVAELVRDEFGVEHPIVALQSPPEEFGTLRRAWMDLLGGRSVHLSRWIRHLDNDRARLLTLDLLTPGLAAALWRVGLDFEHEQVLLICGWEDRTPRFNLREEGMASLQKVTILVQEGEVPKSLRRFLALPAEQESLTWKDVDERVLSLPEADEAEEE